MRIRNTYEYSLCKELMLPADRTKAYVKLTGPKTKGRYKEDWCPKCVASTTSGKELQPLDSRSAGAGRQDAAEADTAA